MSRPIQLTIDLNALQHNLSCVRKYAPHSAVMAMVKANAYGHGMVDVAKALSQADAFGVASLEEGITLREAGIDKPIVLIEGLYFAEELTAAAKYHFTLVVHHLPQVDMLENARMQSVFPVWLKVNSGMHRLGVPAKEASAIYQRLQQIQCVKQVVGLMTHFAEADDLESMATQKQMHLFEEVTQALQGMRSLANSAAILTLPKTHIDWVRPGLMLYGAAPFADKRGMDFGLQPVMSLSSRLIAINRLAKGARLGYGGTWIAKEDTIVGIVAAGYGDGYPQFAPNGTPVLVNGAPCLLAGRVSMDMLAVDLSNHPDAKIGDEVLLWGKNLPVEVLAKHVKTSAYEILTRMTARPKRKIIG